MMVRGALAFAKQFVNGKFQVELLMPPSIGTWSKFGFSPGGLNGFNLESVYLSLQWLNHSNGTQKAFRVRVFLNSTLATVGPSYNISPMNMEEVVLDTGWVFSPATQWSGRFHGRAIYSTRYFFVIDVIDNLGQEGQSAVFFFTDGSVFSSDFTFGQTAPTLVVRGGCDGDKLELPGIQLTWRSYVPGSDETFHSYEVYRREPAAADPSWKRMFATTDSAVRTWTDYEVASRAVYQYKVMALIIRGTLLTNTSFLVDGHIGGQGAATGSVTFDWTFIHDKDDPTKYVRFDNALAVITRMQDISYHQPWARLAPTVFIGDKDSRTLRLTSLSESSRRDRIRQGSDQLFTLQRTDAVTFVARHGQSSDLMYCAIGNPSVAMDLKAQSTTLELTETHAEVGVPFE